MSPGLAARTAIVYALCAAIVAPAVVAQPLRPPSGPIIPGPPVTTGPTTPASERRTVAVIDLAGDQRSRDLATLLGNELAEHAVLKPLIGVLSAELLQPFVDEDAENINTAKMWLERTTEKLASHALSEALSNAGAGQEQLHRVAPTAQVRAMYADFAFAIGVAKLGDKKLAEAEESFALSYRLNPERKLDDDTTTPDVIAAFEAARKAALSAKTVSLGVSGTGRHTWIDGVDRGPPGHLDVTVGRHVVWLTGPDRQPAAQQISVTESRRIDIEDLPADDLLKVRRARWTLRSADDTARAGAMQALAKLLKVGDAILITASPNGKLIVQTWRDREPGFSAYREYKGEQPLALLEPLAPPRRRANEPPGPPGGKPLPPPPPRWYEKRNTWIAVGGGAALVTATLLKIFLHAKVPLDTNPIAH